MTLINKAFEELEKAGFVPKYDFQNQKVFRISRDKNGAWFMGAKNGYNYYQDRLYLNLEEGEPLKALLDSVVRKDTELFSLGGRVFISKDLIYKKKNGELIFLQ